MSDKGNLKKEKLFKEIFNLSMKLIHWQFLIIKMSGFIRFAKIHLHNNIKTANFTILFESNTVIKFISTKKSL